MTEVIITALMNAGAALEPAILKTNVKGEVAESRLKRPGVSYGILRPIRRMEII